MPTPVWAKKVCDMTWGPCGGDNASSTFTMVASDQELSGRGYTKLVVGLHNRTLSDGLEMATLLSRLVSLCVIAARSQCDSERPRLLVRLICLC